MEGKATGVESSDSVEGKLAGVRPGGDFVSSL